MSFDPNRYLIDLRGRKYLPVFARVLAFRDVHPDGSISTEILSFDPLVVKAQVVVDGITIATGHATAARNERAVWAGREIEKAETAAIGRALAHAGFGTEYEPGDEDNLADTPVPAQPKQAAPWMPQQPAAHEREENPYKRLMSKPAGGVDPQAMRALLLSQHALGTQEELEQFLNEFLLGGNPLEPITWAKAGVKTPQDGLAEFKKYVAARLAEEAGA